MSQRTVAGWGAGLLVVVGAVAAVLINELHGGWGWWVGAVGVVVVWAVGTGWLAYRSGGFAGVDQSAGSVVADRIRGSVRTETAVEGWRGSTPMGMAVDDGGGDVVGEGAVRARLIGGDVSARAFLRASPGPATSPVTSGPPGVW